MGKTRILLLLSLLVVCPPLGLTQQEALSWIPHQTGDRWIYQHESKDFTGDPQKPEIQRWTTEETVKGLVTIPEGLIIERHVRQDNESGAVQTTYVDVYGRGDRLVRGDCVYFLDLFGWGRGPGPGPAWDSVKKKLNPQFHEALINGTVSPAACFPLKVGKQWGTSSDRLWRVVGSGGWNLFSPPLPGEAFHMVTKHFTSGGRLDVWLQKGIGVVGYDYRHSGTYGESTEKLLQFIPAYRAVSPGKTIP
ncbi:MAG: hypothetical protein ACRD10_02690 [Terriglobia bacterium]